MRIFVAGATGVLGRRVVRELVAQGHAVAGLSRSDANDAVLRLLGAEPRRADLFDESSLAKAAEGAEAVLHLAGAVPRTFTLRRSEWALNDRIRREGTKALLAAAKGAALYVQASVALLYGDRKGLVRETAELPASPHALLASAADMEKLVAASGLRAATLRLGRLYAGDDDRSRLLVERVHRRRLPYYGEGDALTSWIHADDAAAAFAAAVEKGATGVFNVADDRPVSTKEFLEWLAAELGAKGPWDLPLWVGWLLLGPSGLKLATLSLAVDNTKLKDELGWKPRHPTFREGWKEVAREVRGTEAELK